MPDDRKFAKTKECFLDCHAPKKQSQHLYLPQDEETRRDRSFLPFASGIWHGSGCGLLNPEMAAKTSRIILLLRFRSRRHQSMHRPLYLEELLIPFPILKIRLNPDQFFLPVLP